MENQAGDGSNKAPADKVRFVEKLANNDHYRRHHIDDNRSPMDTGHKCK